MERILILVSLIFSCLSISGIGNINKPTVPGVDVTKVGNSETLYIYNVEADAFVTYGMNWNTNAIATRLCDGDYSISTRHQCKVMKQSNGSYLLQNEGNNTLYIGTNYGENDVWIDFSQNTEWNITSVGTNIYNIKSGNNLLDVSFAYGGHLTTKNGQGKTTWAFILPQSITDGSYSLYKAKLRFYNLYNAFVEAGVDINNSAMMAAASEYNRTGVTVESLRTAAQALFRSQYSSLKKTTNITDFLKNADMLGNHSTESWSATEFVYNYADIEYYHKPFVLQQSISNLPTGMYTVVLHSLSRTDGSDALPTLSAKGSDEAKVFLPDMRNIDWRSNSGGNSGWKLDGKYYRPDNMLSAGQAMTSADAVAMAEYAPVNGTLTITVNENSYANWDNFQSFELLYTPISTYYAIKKSKAEEGLAKYKNTAAPAIIHGLTAQLNAINENNTSSATAIDAFRCGNTIDKLVDNAESTIEPYAKLKSLIYKIHDFEGDASSLVSPMQSANNAINTATTAAELNNAYTRLYNAYLMALIDQAKDDNDLPEMLITDGYYARGSEDIFGRFSFPETMSSNYEKGLLFSASEKKPTVSNCDGKSTETINYCGTIYKICNLTPATAYWIRPYAKINDKTTIYGPTTKVYTLPKGGIKYNIRTSGNAEYDNNVTNAIKTMVDYWNRYTNIQGYGVNAGYKEGVPTAECSYGGYMSFGPNTSYQQCGTAMHESMHGIGVGTSNNWNTLCNGKNWIGPRVNEFVKFWENNESATFYGDRQHGWCTNSTGGLSYTINGAHEDKNNDLQRTANSLLAQAMGEDGLRPTNGSWLISPYYSFEQNDECLYYIINKKSGEYLTDNKKTLQVSATRTTSAQWHITFDPSDQTYRIKSRNGNMLSHENYVWGLNVYDKRIVMAESTSRDSYWFTTPTTDGKCLDANLSCVNTDLTGNTPNTEWQIIPACQVSLVELTRLINYLNSPNSSSSSYSNDLDADGDTDMDDLHLLVSILLSK